MKKLKYQFAPLPLVVAGLKSLSDGAKVVYALLTWHRDNDGIAFPSYRTLARETGKGTSTVFRAVRELADHKLVIMETPAVPARGRFNRYLVVELEELYGIDSIPLPTQGKQGKGSKVDSGTFQTARNNVIDSNTDKSLPELSNKSLTGETGKTGDKSPQKQRPKSKTPQTPKAKVIFERLFGFDFLGPDGELIGEADSWAPLVYSIVDEVRQGRYTLAAVLRIAGDVCEDYRLGKISTRGPVFAKNMEALRGGTEAPSASAGASEPESDEGKARARLPVPLKTILAGIPSRLPLASVVA